ncbi:MAG: CPBP family intramembrane metalloprotease [Candidatus Glassbacteria bacterium]|nr:CPBP family intramembrane metalloprotease [Candidatus Glassbacteria bacterium]
MADAAMLLGVVVVFFLLISFLLIKTPGWTLPGGINSRFVAVLMIELVGVGLPVAVFLKLKRLDPAAALGLRPAGVVSLAGAALMGLATVVVAPQFEAWQARLVQPPERYLEALADFVSLEQGESLAWALVCLALVPALCEEALFRGVLLRACLPRWKTSTTIVVIGLVFGLFHFDLWRWPLLSAIGMLLTWCAVKAGSVWPAFVFHLVNNTASLLLANSDWPSREGWTTAAADVPPGLFALGAVLLAAGAGLVGGGRRHGPAGDER